MGAFKEMVILSKTCGLSRMRLSPNEITGCQGQQDPLKLQKVSKNCPHRPEIENITGQGVEGGDGEVLVSCRRPHRSNDMDHELLVGDLLVLQSVRDERSRVRVCNVCTI